MSYTPFDRFVAWQRFRAAISYVEPGSRVCDVGCGLEAGFLRYARSRIQSSVGLDYQRLRSLDAQWLVQCDLTRGIPLKSGRFDHTVMLAVLEHLEDPTPMLAEIFRILAPGGSLIMTWPNLIVDPILNVLHSIGLVSGEMESDKHQPRVPVEQLISILKEIGFAQFKHRRFELGMNNLLVSWKP